MCDIGCSHEDDRGDCDGFEGTCPEIVADQSPIDDYTGDPEDLTSIMARLENIRIHEKNLEDC